MINKTYFIIHHQHKGKPIELALRHYGWRFTHHKANIALLDHTINRGSPNNNSNIINRLQKEGSCILTYPHGATGAWWLDLGLFNNDAKVFCHLVIAEGQKRISQIIDDSTRAEIIGWYYCPQKPFERPKQLKRILFASIHPPEKSTFRPEAYEANQRVFKALEKITDKYGIIVRHINSLSANGLKYNPKMIMNNAKPDGSYDDIDNADLVIAEGTFMYLAIARGKPTIGINQHIPIRANNIGLRREPLHWEKYGEFMAYPIDFDDRTLEQNIEKALNEEQKEWRKMFIGEQSTDKKIHEMINGLLIESKKQK